MGTPEGGTSGSFAVRSRGVEGPGWGFGGAWVLWAWLPPLPQHSGSWSSSPD